MQAPIQLQITKIALCISILAALTSLLVSTLSLAEREHDLIAQLVPLTVLIGIWRVAGWLWFYLRHQHACWSFEYLRAWWRAAHLD